MKKQIFLILILMTVTLGAKDHVLTGIATWYGQKPFLGNRTPSGIICDGVTPQAAHKTLPFGTVVRAFNIGGKISDPQIGKDMIVVITDRGPYVKGRILDLNAKWSINRLCGKKCGMANVALEIVDSKYACTEFRCLSKMKYGNEGKTFGKRLESHEIKLLGLTER